MNIFAVNGSPKIGVSNSGTVLSIIRRMLPEDVQWNDWCPAEAQRKKLRFDVSLLQNAEVMLIACPLYVDGLHSTLMLFMEQHQQMLRECAHTKRIFAVVNCGFYEGKQNEHALEMIRFYSRQSGQNWCGGTGIGTGEMISGLNKISPEAGIRKPVIRALRSVAVAIASPYGCLKEPVFTQHGLPWFLFKLAGEFGWRQSAKKNGLKTRDLFAKPLPAP